MRSFLPILLLVASIAICSSTLVSDTEWTNYKNTYLKTYATTSAESTARYYYAVNKAKIATHNARYTKGLESYSLDVNQFTDLRFLEFAALFPLTVDIPSNGVAYTASTVAPQVSFSYTAQGFSSPVQDQGQVCNSGWAYASATAIQIFDAVITGSLTSQTLSAQNFIDCAGSAKACTKQVSQIAFDYLTQYAQKAYPIGDYPNQPTVGQGMCILPASQVNAVSLTSYSNIANGNDTALMSVVNYVAPVVIKFNPGSFEFMHYKEGVFTQPAPTQSASHYMTVVGFDTDTVRAMDYWLVENSFGTLWGESGFIRIQRNTAKPIANSAVFPSA